ncbi:molybdate ABC transporter substrate-binding protein [Shewanella sp. KCT]|uniref:molybdate ABC transporter substrate-binding protein n=1 Tax=Shewanella sp. KCT TaxID=2569535 RepID=UPI001182C7D8|nr:molybdate ABC transporter substrate-binding protein [Shewanella sp. KCT]TVP13819.1 molybdenum ABC transporter substrate-binding protein [Shewanella sp. KCT]
MDLLRGFVLGCLLLLGVTPSWAAEVPAIAAASNIKFALDKIAADFTKDTGKRVRISYGSSGNFVAQLRHGAPFELFLSADDKYIYQLHKLGVTQSDGEIYAIGRLALAAPKRSPLSLDAELVGVKTLLEQGGLKRFAIANPDHAPYGERAREALQHLGLWQPLQPYLIYGENVSQAAQFALSGSTDGGIVALSLAMAPQFRAASHYVALPSEWHSPMNQRMVLTPKAGETAKAFYAYLSQAKARAVFLEFGFGLPGDSLGNEVADAANKPAGDY